MASIPYNKHQRKWVLVTGAASGIGRAITLLLAQRGFGVYATDLFSEALEDLRQITNIVTLPMDITKDEDVKNILEYISAQATGLFALINNAGIFNPGPLMALSMERFVQQYSVNVFGTQRITKGFFPLLLNAGGRIVNLSSVAGYVATPFSGPYASTKHAIEGWSDALRRELMPFGVKVIVVEPALVNTPLWDKDFEGRVELYRDSIFFEANRKKLVHEAAEAKARGVRPDAVAETVLYALTNKNPKPRYLVSNHPLLHRLVKFLPDKLLDRVLTKAI